MRKLSHPKPKQVTLPIVFRPRPLGRYVAIVGDFIPMLRHKIARPSHWKAGARSVTHIPCAKEVVAEEPGPRRVTFRPGAQPCPACRAAERVNRKVWHREFHYPCLIGLLERDDDREEGLVLEESVLIWKMTPKQMKRLDVLGVQRLETRVLIERGRNWNSRIKIEIYDGPPLYIPGRLQECIREIEEAGVLERLAEPPSFVDLQNILQARLEALDPSAGEEFRSRA
ncbi:MAG: hypothetical protein O7H41_20825 [Planctomycetota bacterium]|nr:hypothetical protein [Planctomycetota bacterium]